MQTIHQYEPLWGLWKVDKLLYENDALKTYIIYNNIQEGKPTSAATIIAFPTTKEMFEQMKILETDNVQTHQSVMHHVSSQLALWKRCGEQDGIVHLYDYSVYGTEGSEKGDVIFRTEVVRQLFLENCEAKLANVEIARLGIYTCNAIAFYMSQNTNLTLRQENFFVTQMGVYKIGGFGLSRCTSVESKDRSAAENAHFLGVLLAQLLYKNRKRQANNGTLRQPMDVSLPQKAVDKLMAISLRASSKMEAERYTSIVEMRASLEQILLDAGVPVSKLQQKTPENEIETVPLPYKEKSGGKTAFKILLIILIVVALILLEIFYLGFFRG